MSDPDRKQPPLYVRIGCALAVSLAPVAIYLVASAAIEQQRRNAEAKAKEEVLSQIGHFRHCSVPTAFLSHNTIQGGWGMLSVGHTTRTSGITPRPFQLEVCYANHVDALLEQIAGQPGLVSLSLVATDVSDAGLASVATLPDLEELSITLSPQISEAGVDALRAGRPDCKIAVKPVD